MRHVCVDTYLYCICRYTYMYTSIHTYTCTHQHRPHPISRWSSVCQSMMWVLSGCCRRIEDPIRALHVTCKASVRYSATYAYIIRARGQPGIKLHAALHAFIKSKINESTVPIPAHSSLGPILWAPSSWSLGVAVSPVNPARAPAPSYPAVDNYKQDIMAAD